MPYSDFGRSSQVVSRPKPCQEASQRLQRGPKHLLPGAVDKDSPSKTMLPLMVLPHCRSRLEWHPWKVRDKTWDDAMRSSQYFRPLLISFFSDLLGSSFFISTHAHTGQLVPLTVCNFELTLSPSVPPCTFVACPPTVRRRLQQQQ